MRWSPVDAAATVVGVVGRKVEWLVKERPALRRFAVLAFFASTLGHSFSPMACPAWSTKCSPGFANARTRSSLGANGPMLFRPTGYPCGTRQGLRAQESRVCELSRRSPVAEALLPVRL